jgi:hypothetical protein
MCEEGVCNCKKINSDTVTEIGCNTVSEFKKMFKTFVRGAMKSGIFALVDENNMKSYTFKVGKVSFGKGKDFISMCIATDNNPVANKFVLYNDLIVAKRVYNKVTVELLNKLVEQFKKQKNVKDITVVLSDELVC